MPHRPAPPRKLIDDITELLDYLCACPKQLLDTLRRFVQGDAEPYKSLWSHADDVTIFGGWGAYEQGWTAVEPRLEWAASRFSDGWLDRENLIEGMDQAIAYSVDSNAVEGGSNGICAEWPPGEVTIESKQAACAIR
jgi:hypothetical protein